MVPTSENEVIYSRWQSFCAMCLYMSFAGTIYAFNIYGELLKVELDFSQSSLSTIASIGNCGNLLGVMVGYGIETYGAKLIMSIGSICVFSGYLYIWLAIKHYVYSNVALVTLFYFIAQMGVSCYINTALTSTIKLFPSEKRGSAIGLCRAYFGLSSAVLGDLAGGVFQLSPISFVLFVSLFVPFTGLIGTVLSSSLPSKYSSFDYERKMGYPKSLNTLFYHWIISFFLLFIVGYLQLAISFNAVQLTICSAVVVLFMLSLLLVPLAYGPRVISPQLEVQIRPDGSEETEKFKKFLSSPSTLSQREDLEYHQRHVTASMADPEKTKSQNSYAALEIDASAVKAADDPESEGESEHSSLLASPVPHYQLQLQQQQHGKISPKGAVVGTNGKGSKAGSGGAKSECFYGSSLDLEEAVQTWRYWAIFTIFFTVSGCAFLLVFNLTDIAVSIGAEASAFYVTLVALGSGVGKITAGKASDWCVRHGYISTLEMQSVVCLLMCWLMVMLSFGRKNTTLGCFFWVGFANGATLSLISIIVTDIYGWTHIATTLPLIDIAPILGSFFFSNTLMALFYRENAVDPETDLPVCIGAGCYATAFRISAVCCSLCAIGTVYLHIKTKI